MEIFRNHPQWNDVKKICAKLKENGFVAWLAGGCVRDGLLGVMPKDFDIATNARPKKIESLFDKTVDVGKAFGVIRVVRESGDIEVATFRKDGPYLDGRHPKSVELSTPEEDAQRRDFTVNALFFDITDDQIHDFVNGLEDLKKRIIRAVGVAADRFMEDKLRVLRAVRFVSQLDFDLEKLTYDAVCQYATSITQVSPERISDELAKLFKGIRPDRGVQLLNETGLLQLIVPEINYDKTKENLFRAFAGDPDQEMLGWIALFKQIPDQNKHESICRRLRFSNDKLGTLRNALELVTSLEIFDGLGLAEQKRLAAEGEMALAVKYEKALNQLAPATEKFLLENKQLPKRFLDAKDLLAVGIKPGKELGRLLEEIFDAQLEGRVKNRGEALQLVTKKKS